MKKPPQVRLVYLEPRYDGGKVGLDDFFANGGAVATLLAQATAELRLLPRKEPETDPLWPYEITPHGIFLRKAVGEKFITVPLSNFTARIRADIRKDDGAEVQRLFEIEARLGSRCVRKAIPADRFASMIWVADLLGAQAILYPGQATKGHTRVAIQKLSQQEVAEQCVYAHLGWRKIDERWVYLHAGGAIGAEGVVGGIAVQVSDALARFQLPEPPGGQQLIDTIQRSLGLLTVAPQTITVPGFAAVFRAALGNTPFSLHYAGQTGHGKTELAALCQRFYGAEMDASNLPGSWSSTGNAMEGLAFEAKDVLLVVDDFAPSGSATDVQGYHKQAERLLRAQGNRSGRLRMRSDGTLRAAKPPRGLILSTGEDVPRGHSIRARTIVMEVGPIDVNWSVLSKCQKEAAEGVYAAVFAAYIRWLAPQHEEVKARLASEIQQLRQEATAYSEHRRTPDNVANLALGLRYFLRFAEEAGAISQEQTDVLWAESWKALLTTAQAQSAHHAANEPARRFLELLTAVLTSGRAHMTAPTGSKPQDPEVWGWWQKTIGTGGYQRIEWQPQGARIGWIDGDALYLEPESSYAVAQQLARDQGESLPVTPQTLRKRLNDKGYLASHDQARETLTMRRKLEGRERSVLHFARKLFVEGLSIAQKPDRPDIHSHRESEGAESDEGTDKKADLDKQNPTNPTSYPTSESEAKANSSNGNGGNVGFLRKKDPTVAGETVTTSLSPTGITMQDVEEVFPACQVAERR